MTRLEAGEALASVSGFEVWPYALPVLVLSETLAASPVPEALRGRVGFADLAPRAALELLARKRARRVYVDGGKVVQAFLRAGLITGIVAMHVPVLLGAGRPLFGETGGDIALKHVGTTAFASGLVQSRYEVDI